ncbi:MAG: ribosomal-processing cysteine protease Prp [Eubacterium sp.]|nr:ribosomal-processing cysteine protease Prp [Eubacterium sp.]
MIKVCFYSKNNTYFGFKIVGHADYGCCGKDVVCAGVSALVINTVNSIEKFTEDSTCTEEFESGLVKFKIMGDVSNESKLLLRSLRLGLCSIYEEYGDKYIQIFFREVSHV